MQPDPTAPCVSYQRHRFPAELISHCVWRSHRFGRFGLSLRDVQDLLAERGVAVRYETIHQWCRKFGLADTQAVRRRRPRPGDTWPVDEVQPKINGRRHWLWRAVDQEGVALDILVQARRNRKAAERFLRRVLDGCRSGPRVVITDKLASSPAARRWVLPGLEHRRHRRLNHRAEHAHRLTRRRERAMQRVKSPEPAQHVQSCFESIRGHCCPRRHVLPAAGYRA